ncbi:uncharacterized protein Ecym_6437 [Eremothecium cymbalariae DBVPG|uniref:Uncharacterized protein n=1 Tax=Eremothecium cymbalariae (strain CBS 270.75 / DBVPG 7215 / KCTC 17166 / NRRL Y-17582) TaxID=931890 RepID=G8JUM8_ERECY|nr:hypothetical protein Ecym_6437 [Eremothecium cymbalariae DBVPG\
MLSDVVKTLRSYANAFQLYEKALGMSCNTSDDSYNILYNQTRLLLMIFTEYTAANGYINLLKYVNLDGITDLEGLLIPIDVILTKFEAVLVSFPDQHGWDLYFNLLTCYLMYVEFSEPLIPEKFLQVCKQFIELSHKLLQVQLDALENDSSMETESDAKVIEDAKKNLKEVDGIPVNQPMHSDTEVAEMSDSITPQTLIDSLSLIYKFIAAVTETIIESRKMDEVGLNHVHINYLDDLMSRFLIQVNEIRSSFVQVTTVDTKELKLAIRSVEGLSIIANGSLQTLEKFIDNSDPQEIEEQLHIVDILQTACTNPPPGIPEWTLCCMLDKVLRTAQHLLTSLRSQLISGSAKDNTNQLSPTVFRLCDILNSRCDNEIRRFCIKKQELQTSTSPEQTDDTINLLLKNAQTLATNSAAIAQLSCGFREYIIDKLKRNYIFQQAKLRVHVILGTEAEYRTASDLEEFLNENSQYTVLSS